ncbi:DNA-binding response regulator [Flavipsychrobacter stenotrophus]|uniref:DNA-binding response regulator n=1 Tax=Flavipsychrobacter stenotrophus TaxID=2077091 RepID=A0A2S7SPJ5_9BACT|nr:response regulator transcription factor [Flavipsychrobacter stenotrophus]PQJ08809.1 DNA-binding response regulator [Flavipsychrobacter stenotrophus]
MKILIVEDERSLNNSMVEYLTSQGYLCESVLNYRDALQKIDLYDYDCIILDIMLPGGSGLDLLKELRTERKLDGVIIISAKNSLDDKLAGLKLGADDYLTKPFHLAELSMRISAIVRRKNSLAGNLVKFEEIIVDTDNSEVSINDKPVALTKTEYKFLLYFIINKNKVLTKNTLAEYLWGDNMDLVEDFDFMYAHIKNLRKKLQQAGCGDYLHSIYGTGYKFSYR